jgi:hypothetical protein
MTEEATQHTAPKARYRKVDPRIWNDAKFCALSNTGKLIFFYLLTHPNMTALGAMRGTVAGLAEELGEDVETFRENLAQMVAFGMVEHDAKARYIGLPKFLNYNPPAAPNTIKAWAASLDLIPECASKVTLLQRCQAFAEQCGESWAKAFKEAFAKALAAAEEKASPIQCGKAPDMPSAMASVMPSAMPKAILEQEQELELEQEQKGSELRSGVSAGDEKSDAWKAARSLLAEQGMALDQTGAFIGGLIRQHNEAPVLAAIQDAIAKQPAGAKAWIVAATKRHAGTASKPPKADFAARDYTKGF